MSETHLARGVNGWVDLSEHHELDTDGGVAITEHQRLPGGCLASRNGDRSRVLDANAGGDAMGASDTPTTTGRHRSRIPHE